MTARRGLPRDPFEGQGALRLQRRLRIKGLIALGMSIGSCGLTAAVWIKQLVRL